MKETRQREKTGHGEADKSAAIQVLMSDPNGPEEYDPKKGKILVVGNRDDVREIAVGFLKGAGYANFIVAADGERGIDATYRYHPDIIICDDDMPDMKGRVFRETIARNPDFRRIPFVLISSIADRTAERDVTAYLGKPIVKEELVSTVDAQLARYMELRLIIGGSTVDELTGTHNKKGLEEIFGRYLSMRKLRPVSVVCVAVDDVRAINRKYGHPAGDAAIALAGKIIRETIRLYDFTGRYEFNKFIIVLPDTTRAQAVIVAGKLGAMIRQSPVACDGNEFGSTATFGIVSLVEDDRAISGALGLESLATVYDIAGQTGVDWGAVDGIKLSLVEILISLSLKAARRAGEIRCGDCGFTSEDANEFADGECPECGSAALSGGRDSMAVLSDSYA